MKNITANYLNNFLYNHDNGFLIKYHFEQGLDLVLLDQLYDILEELKKEWKEKELIPKDIIFHLIGIIPSLYMDLPIYASKEGCGDYEDRVYVLNTAIMMCLNPNVSDPNYKIPLRDLTC